MLASIILFAIFIIYGFGNYMKGMGKGKKEMLKTLYNDGKIDGDTLLKYSED